jgi:hypothetical protein
LILWISTLVAGGGKVFSQRDPYLRKEKPVVNPGASKTESLPELLNRGHQLLLQLDREHERIRHEVQTALRPVPQAWKGARLAKGDYDAAYAELMALSKRINTLLAEEHPEFLQCNPEPAASFGLVQGGGQQKRRERNRDDPPARGPSYR